MNRLEEEARIGKAGTLAAQLSRLDVVVLDELARSVPGIAAAPKRSGDPDHYVSAALLSEEPAPLRPMSSPVPVETVQPLVSVDGDTEAEDGPNDLMGHPEKEYAAEAGTVSAGQEAMDDTMPPPDPYDLPFDLPRPEWDTLMAAAEGVVAANSDWAEDLYAANGKIANEFMRVTTAAGGPTKEAEDIIIAAVAAAPDVPGSTPFRYFVDVARMDGVENGYHAYEAATINRIAFEMWSEAKAATDAPSDHRLSSPVTMLARQGRGSEGQRHD